MKSYEYEILGCMVVYDDKEKRPRNGGVRLATAGVDTNLLPAS